MRYENEILLMEKSNFILKRMVILEWKKKRGIGDKNQMEIESRKQKKILLGQAGEKWMNLL